VVIRAAVAADVEPARRVEIEAGRRFAAVGMPETATDEAPPPQWFLAAVDEGRCWVAASGPEVVGYVVAEQVDGDAFIAQVSVVEAWGRRGIGTGLIGRVEAWAGSWGARSVVLTTFEGVAWNAPWYRRIGFVDVDQAEFGPGLEALVARERSRGLDGAARVVLRRRLASDGPARGD